MDVIAIRPTLTALALASICLALAACSGGSTGADSARADNPSDEDEDKLVATIESIQEHVFGPHCLSCHNGGSAPAGLRLENAGVSYANLVDIASQQNPLRDRVAPGDPDNSYLIHKLEGTNLTGSQMPQGREPMTAETIAVIRDWIEQGAAPPDTDDKALFLPARSR